jgi:hypothetical protein
MRGSERRAAVLTRWVARGLGGALVLFWGVFLIAHLVGDAGVPSRPLAWTDHALVTALMVALAGLVVAWRWEAAGAVTTLVATGVCVALNWRTVAFPGTLIPITAILYLAAWWTGRRRGVQSSFGRSGGIRRRSAARAE